MKKVIVNIPHVCCHENVKIEVVKSACVNPEDSTHDVFEFLYYEMPAFVARMAITKFIEEVSNYEPKLKSMTVAQFLEEF